MKITGSGFERAEKCAPSTFLPRVKEAPSDYAKLGTVIHRFLCLVAEVGAEAAFGLIEEEFLDVCRSLDLDALPHSKPETWAVEVAYAWDFVKDTARELYRGSGEREYAALGENEVAGTADLVGLDGETVIVLDVKTGWSRLGTPAESLQLGFYAVAAARAYGCSRARVGWVRLADGVPKYEHDELDEIDLAAMAERLKTIVADAQFAEIDHQTTGALKLVSGDHCSFCPSFLTCPAKATLLRELAKQEPANDSELVLSAEQVPAMLDRLWAMEKVLERVKKAIDEYATGTPVKFPDGRIYGQQERTTERIDPDIGKQVLAKLNGIDFANECVEVKKTLTKAAIERALKSRLKPGEKFAPLERKTHEALRAAGGVKTSTYWALSVTKPKLLKGEK